MLNWFFEWATNTPLRGGWLAVICLLVAIPAGVKEWRKNRKSH